MICNLANCFYGDEEEIVKGLQITTNQKLYGIESIESSKKPAWVNLIQYINSAYIEFFVAQKLSLTNQDNYIYLFDNYSHKHAVIDTKEGVEIKCTKLSLKENLDDLKKNPDKLHGAKKVAIYNWKRDLIWLYNIAEDRLIGELLDVKIENFYWQIHNTVKKIAIKYNFYC